MSKNEYKRLLGYYVAKKRQLALGINTAISRRQAKTASKIEKKIHRTAIKKVQFIEYKCNTHSFAEQT